MWSGCSGAAPAWSGARGCCAETSRGEEPRTEERRNERLERVVGWCARFVPKLARVATAGGSEQSGEEWGEKTKTKAASARGGRGSVRALMRCKMHCDGCEERAISRILDPKEVLGRLRILSILHSAGDAIGAALYLRDGKQSFF